MFDKIPSFIAFSISIELCNADFRILSPRSRRRFHGSQTLTAPPSLLSQLRKACPNATTLAYQHKKYTSKNAARSTQLAPTLSIRDWNAWQNPLAVIGRYVELDSRGIGCCPFGWHHSDGRDSHPSFKVYEPRFPGGYCWYCRAWGHGGSVFDFLSLYYNVETRDLWRRIQAGEQF